MCPRPYYGYLQGPSVCMAGHRRLRLGAGTVGTVPEYLSQLTVQTPSARYLPGAQEPISTKEGNTCPLLLHLEVDKMHKSK